MKSHIKVNGKRINRLLYIAHYLIIWANFSTFGNAACPKLCHCKWRDGKETVSCPDADFIDIPRGLDTTTQVLDLRRNNLKILPNDAFLDTGLVNLQKVWLNYCKLKYIIDGAFRHLANLIELDLGDNALAEIPSSPLADISGLRTLSISRNYITVIYKEAFKSVPLLVKLDLSHNNISSVDENSFAFLNRLEDLKLSFNQLKTLPVNVLQPLAGLHGLHVDNNPWHCNCHLRLLRQWLLERNVAASIPPKCLSPDRLRGRGWQTLDEDEFVCVPLVTAVAQRVIASHGDNVTLACKVETDDDAAVTWLVGDKTLANTAPDSQRKYSVLELDNNDSGARVSNLTIEGAVVQDQGTYRCVAENKAGRVETNLTLKVSEEITEVRYVAKEEKINPFPEWIIGVIAGSIGVIIIFIILITFRFRRKRKSSVKNQPLDLELDSKDSDNSNCGEDNVSPSIQFIGVTKTEASDFSCASVSVDARCKAIQEPLVDDGNQLVSHIFHNESDNGYRSQSISYVEIPRIYDISTRQVINISQLEAMLGSQLSEMSPPIFFDPRDKFPDLLDITSGTPTINMTHNVFTNTGSTGTNSVCSSSVCTQPHCGFDASRSSLPGTSGRNMPAATGSSFSYMQEIGTNNTSVPTKRHVHFQDEMGKDIPDTGESKQLLQYHATQLYKFLQEYKQLQVQLQSFKLEQHNSSLMRNPSNANECTSFSPTTNSSETIPDIQSSIEYLLAHQASIPPPIIDTINQLSSNQDPPSRNTEGSLSEEASDILAQLPPPPNFAANFQSNEIQPALHIIPPPSSHISSTSPLTFPMVHASSTSGQLDVPRPP